MSVAAKSAIAEIERWLEGVKAGPRLKAAGSCFLIAHALSRRTNGNEFRKSGRLITWQSIPTMAGDTGLSERMVRYAVRRLEAAGHLAVMTGHGPRQSNRYTLIENRHSGAAINSGNSSTRVPHIPEQMRHSGSPNAAPGCAESGTRVPPNSSITHSLTLPPTDDTEPGGPRLRAEEALGPLPPAMGELDAPLRDLLGERWKWLVGVKLEARTADTVTLAVTTPSARDNIIRHCEADILAVAGASKLEFKFLIAVDVPPLRRMP
jgi:hypothetical protein